MIIHQFLSGCQSESHRAWVYNSHAAEKQITAVTRGEYHQGTKSVTFKQIFTKQHGRTCWTCGWSPASGQAPKLFSDESVPSSLVQPHSVPCVVAVAVVVLLTSRCAHSSIPASHFNGRCDHHKLTPHHQGMLFRFIFMTEGGTKALLTGLSVFIQDF